MTKDRLTFTLMDLGYKKAGPVQIYDERTTYDNGEIIPFPAQLAIVTHARMLRDTKHGEIFQRKSQELIDAWTNSELPGKVKCDASCVSEPNAFQYCLFNDLLDVPFPGPENPKKKKNNLFAEIGGDQTAYHNPQKKFVFSSFC